MANKVIKMTEYPESLPDYWNPYHSFQKNTNNTDDIFTHIKNTLSPFINSNIIYILGPMNRNMEEYVYKFRINLDEHGDTFFKMTTLQQNEFATLSIKNNYFTKIHDDQNHQRRSCELSNVSKNDINSGKDLIEWAKIIAIVLGFTSMYLQDNSYITCPTRNKLFNRRFDKSKDHEFPLRTLSILKKRIGYYSNFNFYPYKKTNTNFVNKREMIEKKINTLFQTVSWSDFDVFFSKLNETINIIQKNKKDNIISIKFNRNLNSWIKYFEEIKKNYNYLKDKFNQLPSPFYAFKYFNNENCKFFIDWLELFQITYTKYLTENYEIYEDNKITTIEIPGIKLLNEINQILAECKWICFTLNVQ